MLVSLKVSQKTGDSDLLLLGHVQLSVDTDCNTSIDCKVHALTVTLRCFIYIEAVGLHKGYKETFYVSAC